MGGNDDCEDTQNAGKYINISTSYTSTLFPDTLTLRYTSFLSPPLCVCVCVCVFLQSTPQRIPQTAVSLLPSHRISQKSTR